MIHIVLCLLLTIVGGDDSSLPLVDYVVESFYAPPPEFLKIDGGMVNTNPISGQNSTAVQCDPMLSSLSIQPDHSETLNVHSVNGATHLSLWYKFVPALTANESLVQGDIRRTIRTVITLLDLDIECDDGMELLGTSLCSEGNKESWTATSSVTVAPNEWHHVVVDLEDGFSLAASTDSSSSFGSGNNGVLDLDRIVDWMIRFDFLDDKPCGGSIELRQLNFHGDGNFIGAALRSRSYAEASYHGAIERIIHISPLSENSTHESLRGDGDFEIQYLAEQREVWGGFIQYRLLPPSRSYYNLSRVETIAFDYQIFEPTYPRGRAHFRLMLFDGEGCQSECRDIRQTEVYYSFHYILEDATNVKRPTTLELHGNQFSNSSFWRTGWVGAERNNILDKEYIKGFGMEIALNSQSPVGTTFSGEFVIDNLHVSPNYDSTIRDTEGIIREPTLRIVNMMGSDLERLEFVNLNKCERVCLDRPDCNFGLSTEYGKDCYVGKELNPGQISLANTTFALEATVSFWKDTVESRGDVCDICTCDPVAGAIDCRGLDLILPPKAAANWTWTPLSLDLRNNPRITVIGRRSLSDFVTLERLFLPANLTYLSPRSLDFLPKLQSVEFEISDTAMVTNVISKKNERFSDKCCSKADSPFFESSPLLHLSFCDMNPDVPGKDLELEPFVQYVDHDQLDIITQGSSFLAEAAESAQKCGAICAIRSNCYYFSFDGRINQSTNICYHYETLGEPFFNCCNPGDYQDEDQTIAGWISGRVPRTRCIENNARTILDTTSKITLDKSSGFRSSYTLRLGANPLRGAVWITPTLLSTTNLDIAFFPTEIALYDGQPVTIEVYLENGPPEEIGDESLLIANLITSCDSAFSTSSSCGSEKELQVLVDFQSPTKAARKKLLTISLTSLLIVIVCLLFSAILYIDRRRGREMAAWKITASDVSYGDSLDVVGRGKFGLVVKASFCGTAVAIKRALPPFDDDKRTAEGRKSNAFRQPSSQSFSLVVEESCPVTSNEGDIESPYPLREARKQHWLKMLEPESNDRKILRSRFLTEMRFLSQLRNSCIVTIMGVIDSSDPLLAMEYMEHGSLRDVLSNETFALNGELLLPIIQDILQGLRFLHSISPQIIHGDLKAANCLVDRRLHVKISDVGLGQRYKTGTRGSPFWMAPELFQPDTANSCQSDVFSFGILLYEIYSRREPYIGEDSLFVLEQVSDPIVQKRPPYERFCPGEISKLTRLCLSHEPMDRPSACDIDEQFKTLTSSDVEPMTRIFSAQPKKHHSSENVLYDIFPRHVADALKEGRKVETEDHELVTIFFSDIVNYTKYSQSMEPRKVANLLDRLYKAFDDLSDLHGVMKVETIGDSWMGVTNLSGSQPNDHVARIAGFSFGAVEAAGKILIDEDNPELGCVVIRVGFHSGPVVADVVGARNPRYCLFGDTVNTASRMESNSAPGLVHCSEASALLLQQQDPSVDIISRGMIDIKGKGPMTTYFVRSKQERTLVSTIH